MARSRRDANTVKKTQPITVVIGNPPYKNQAGGQGGWIESGSTGRAPPMKLWMPLDSSATPSSVTLLLRSDQFDFMTHPQHIAAPAFADLRLVATALPQTFCHLAHTLCHPPTCAAAPALTIRG